MDLAQMLVIGGCAVVGASLGVTVWRLSQTRLIQRMRKKSGPEEDALADEGEETSEEQVAVTADETSSDEAEVTPVEAEAESEVEVAELADAEETPEEEPEPDDSDQLDDPADPDAETAQEAEAEVEDVVEETAVEEQAETGDAGEDVLAIQQQTAAALQEIATRLNDALDRIERLELEQSSRPDPMAGVQILSQEIAEISARLKALEQVEPLPPPDAATQSPLDLPRVIAI